MFEQIPAAPRDPILGLSEAFKEDPNPKKINLSVGVYQDATGKTPILESVRQAGKLVLERQKTMSYLPIPGSPAYAAAVQRLMFGEGHEVETSGRAATSHTPGGTGALRVAADLIHQQMPQATVWLTQPTWPNHPQIFAAAGVPTKTFPYFNAKTNALAFDEAIAAIQKIPAGDVVLLHGCCHNPTGIDPTPDQWKKLADAVYGRGLLPLLDFAYQGFADGIRRRRHRPAGVHPAGCGADGVQLVLQEFRALLRACRRADDRGEGQGLGRHGAEPGEGGDPRELLEPARPRRRIGHDGARRCGPARAVGKRSRPPCGIESTACGSCW